MTNGWKFFSDGTPVAGQQFGYQFDTIGNRLETLAGGDRTGSNPRVAYYTNNTLNQITGRDVPGYADIMGASILSNAVTVAGQTAYRKQEYFRQQIQVSNSSTSVWTNIIVSGGLNVTGNVYVAKEPEAFSYDADGNLTNDGRWAYTWDAENRLTGMAANTSMGPQYYLTIGYDYEGRRIKTIVTTNNVVFTTNAFLYDGWNLVAVLSPTSTIQSSFVWGSDLSGTMQGAGGVGGLLEISYRGTNCFPAYGDNGNVKALVNAADGTLAAEYDYGPFGESVRSTGLMSKVSPFRFSTEFCDDESDLITYAARPYNSSVGRFLAREPIDELGRRLLVGPRSRRLHPREQQNPYRYVNGDPIQKIDPLGLAVCTDPDDWATCAEGCKAKAGQWYLGVKSCHTYYLFFCTRVTCTCRTNCKLARATQDYPGVFFCTYSCLAHQPPSTMTVTIEYDDPGDDWKGCPTTMADDAPTMQEE